MRKHLVRASVITGFALILFVLCAQAQLPQELFFFGDPLPNAPELSWRGEYNVGVRTVEFVHKNQVDVLHTKDGIDPRYDRPLKAEVWYPAILPEGAKEVVTYEQVMGLSNNPKRPLIPFTFNGRALRNAPPRTTDGRARFAPRPAPGRRGSPFPAPRRSCGPTPA